MQKSNRSQKRQREQLEGADEDLEQWRAEIELHREKLAHQEEEIRFREDQASKGIYLAEYSRKIEETNSKDILNRTSVEKSYSEDISDVKQVENICSEDVTDVELVNRSPNAVRTHS